MGEMNLNHTLTSTLVEVISLELDVFLNAHIEWSYWDRQDVNRQENQELTSLCRPFLYTLGKLLEKVFCLQETRCGRERLIKIRQTPPSFTDQDTFKSPQRLCKTTHEGRDEDWDVYVEVTLLDGDITFSRDRGKFTSD